TRFRTTGSFPREANLWKRRDRMRLRQQRKIRLRLHKMRPGKKPSQKKRILRSRQRSRQHQLLPLWLEWQRAREGERKRKKKARMPASEPSRKRLRSKVNRRTLLTNKKWTRTSVRLC